MYFFLNLFDLLFVITLVMSNKYLSIYFSYLIVQLSTYEIYYY